MLNGFKSKFFLIICVLWVFHVVNNFFWLISNVTLIGWDRPRHLVQSLVYNDLLTPFTLHSLIKVLKWPDFYPPLFHLSMVLFYKLFGISGDIAVMVNLIYMAILLWATYGIGARMYEPKVGLLSAFLLSSFPIVFCMSRYSYIDYALMSFVTLGAYLLILNRRFTNTAYSLLFGLVSGLGMLIKWAYPLFLIGPLAVILLKPGNGHYNQQQVKVRQEKAFFTPMVNKKLINLAISAILATLVASIWYVPNWQRALKIGFHKSYNLSDIQDLISLFANPGFCLFYIDSLIREQISPLYFLAFVSALATLAFQAWPALRSGRKLPPFNINTLFLIAWIVIPLVIFTLIESSRNTRLNIAILPAGAILFAYGITRIKGKTLRVSAIVFLILFGMGQFFVLSFDGLSWLPSKTRFNLPSIGNISLFSEGYFIQWPDSGPTAREHWVLPDLYEFILADKQQRSEKKVKFGVLFDSQQLNELNARYLAATEYPEVEAHSLTEHLGGLPVYPQLFAMDYIALLKSSAADLDSGDQSEKVAAKILVNTPQSFSDAFTFAHSFPLPDGDALYLYKNLTYRVPRHIPEDELALTKVQHPKQINLGDEILFIGYTLDTSQLFNEGKIGVDLYWLCLEPIYKDYIIYLKLVNPVYHIWGQQGGRPVWGQYPTRLWEKGQVFRDRRTLEVLPGTPPGWYNIEVVLYDPDGDENLTCIDDQDCDVLIGPVEIPRRECPPVDDLELQYPMEANLGGKVRFLGYNIESSFHAGHGLRLTLFWQALAEMDKDYTVFTHLVDKQNQIWAQKDNPPVDGFYPTSQWQQGEIIRDQYDLVIPPAILPGEYQIEVGIYLARTGERLPLLGEDGSIQDDKMLLKSVFVRGWESDG